MQKLLILRDTKFIGLRSTKEKTKKLQINKIRIESTDNIKDCIEIKTIGKYYKPYYVNKLDKVDSMEKLLKTSKLPKQN